MSVAARIRTSTVWIVNQGLDRINTEAALRMTGFRSRPPTYTEDQGGNSCT